MNSPDHFSPADLKLDQALREALPPLTDDGFTGRVLLALPPPAQPALLTRRWVVCILGAAAGIAFAWQQKGFSAGHARERGGSAKPRLRHHARGSGGHRLDLGPDRDRGLARVRAEGSAAPAEKFLVNPV